MCISPVLIRADIDFMVLWHPSNVTLVLHVTDWLTVFNQTRPMLPSISVKFCFFQTEIIFFSSAKVLTSSSDYFNTLFSEKVYD